MKKNKKDPAQLSDQKAFYEEQALKKEIIKSIKKQMKTHKYKNTISD